MHLDFKDLDSYRMLFRGILDWVQRPTSTICKTMTTIRESRSLSVSKSVRDNYGSVRVGKFKVVKNLHFLTLIGTVHN